MLHARYAGMQHAKLHLCMLMSLVAPVTSR